MSTNPTSPAQLQQAFAAQRRAFAATPYPTLEARLAALQCLRDACAFVSQGIAPALAADFGSHDPSIGLLWELGGVLARIQFTSEHLSRWLEPVDRGSEPAGGARSYVRYQPKGVIGNMRCRNRRLCSPAALGRADHSSCRVGAANPEAV